MRLIWVNLHGYRRFAGETRVNVDLPVIAVVGPNEAGKSSLLQALKRLSDDEPFEATGEGRELTRSSPVEPDQHVVSAEFLLEVRERDAIRGVREANQARGLQVWKRGDGVVDGKLVPTPRRDREPRRRAAEVLRRARESRHLAGTTYEDEGETRELADDVDTVLATLDSDAGSLEAEDVDELELFAQRLRQTIEERHPGYIRELPDRLSAVVVHELAEHPHTTALRIAFSMRPEFLLFSEDDRTLNSTYELEEIAHDPPAALGNLAGLAELDLVDLREAVRAGEWGRVEALEQSANAELERLFHESWRQAAITLRIRVDGTVLRLLVETVPGQYDSIADRSDGLRWFIALLAYTETHGGEAPPVLLVDEAETHLHYDAQADLVRVFAHQRAAAKVIYTTHSAGCLPEDLGAAIRVVAPVPDSEQSEVRNWFWEESPGFSPLFLGMGASALAFTAARRAVIAEGATDLILLPSVLREANGRSELGFQVAPGLAEASPGAIEELGLAASRVAYIVDGDAGGRAVKRKLIRQGVREEQIVTINDGGRGLALEDLLDRDAYLAAVNEELRRSHGDQQQMSRRHMPDSGRPRAVDRWCLDRGLEPPSKRAVANRLLERDTSAPLVDRKRVAAVRALSTALAAVLARRP
jgi:energy-coupling factor transporter ATP-binding protein EcfA2